MAFAAHAAPVTPGSGGGTGISTTTAGNVGNCLQVSSSSPFLTYQFGACSGGAGGGSFSATGTSQQIVVFTSTSAGLGYQNFTFNPATGQINASSVQASILDTGGQVFNIKTFGAKCDGTLSATGTPLGGTNDHAALVAADAAAALVGGEVYVPVGVCMNYSTFTLASGTSLAGAGMGKSFIAGTSTTDYHLVGTTVTGTSTNSYSNIAVHDLSLVSGRGDILWLSNITNVNVHNVELYFTSSTPIKESLLVQNSQNVNVWGNYLHALTGDGVQINGTNYFNVFGNIIRGNTFADDTIDIDGDFANTQTMTSNYGTVNGNTVDNGSRGNGIRVAASNYVTVSNNTVTNIGTVGSSCILVNAYDGYGTSTYANTSHVAVTGNVVSNCLSRGISAVDGASSTASYVLISGNNVENSGQPGGVDIRAGIELAASGTVVTGNYINNSGGTDTSGGAIVDFHSNNTTISDNTITSSTFGIRVWNAGGGAGLTYTGVQILNNRMYGNGTDYTDAITQPGVIIVAPSSTGMYFQNGTTTFQGNIVAAANSTFAGSIGVGSGIAAGSAGDVVAGRIVADTITSRTNGYVTFSQPVITGGTLYGSNVANGTLLLQGTRNAASGSILIADNTNASGSLTVVATTTLSGNLKLGLFANAPCLGTVSNIVSSVNCITTSTNNFGGLTNASITANAPITWSSSNVIGFNTSTAMSLSGLYTFVGGIINNSTATFNSSTIINAGETVTGTASFGGNVGVSGTLTVFPTGTFQGNLNIGTNTIGLSNQLVILNNQQGKQIRIGDIAGSQYSFEIGRDPVSNYLREQGFLVNGDGYEWFTNQGGNSSVRMTLANNGYLGIGTAQPSSTLHVYGSINDTATTTLASTSTWPFVGATASMLQLGTNLIQSGNVSGTWFGVNASSGFNGDFINFGVNSSTVFKVAANGGLALGTNLALPSGYLLNLMGSNSSSTGGTEANITNSNSGAFSEYVLTQDIGTSSNYYSGFGIDNSAWAGGVENPGDTFIEASTTGGLNFEIVTSSFRFFIGGISASTTLAQTVLAIGSSTATTTPIWKFMQAPIDNLGNKFVTSTTGGTGGNGNVYALATSTVIANNFLFYLTAGSSTVSATSVLSELPTFTGLNVTGSLQVTGALTDAAGTKYVTSTAAGGTGNVFVTPSSSVLANNFLQFKSSGSSTVWATSSIFSISAGSSDIAIGTTTDLGLFGMVNSAGTVALSVASTTNGTSSTPWFNLIATSSIFQILASGHVNATGTIPVLSACGTSPSIRGSDTDGEVTVGSVAATSCTITFQIPYEAIPTCVVTSQTASIAVGYSYTTTALTVTNAALTSDKINYTCKLPGL